MTNPKVHFRPFTPQDGYKIAEWFFDPAYEAMFRNTLITPTLEDCANFPVWSQQMVMMVVNEGGETVGMVTGYYLNLKAKNLHCGILLDKKFHGQKYGNSTQLAWFNFLFKQRGFRKIIVENVHMQFTEPYQRRGFEVEGVHKKECLMNGEYVDEIRLACLAENWNGSESLEG